MANNCAAVWSTTGGGVAFFDGVMWAKTWATQWLHMLLHVIWLGTFAAVGGPPAAGLGLAPLIIFNVISVNVDVSDRGFVFFYYAPFWHAAELIRNHLFGTLATRVSSAYGSREGLHPTPSAE